MAKSSIPSEEEALAGMASNSSVRKPSGREGTKFTAPSANPKKGKKVPYQSTAAGDPTGAGTKVNRKATEKMGASYSVGSKYMKQNEPSAGATMANAPIVPAVMQRQKANFSGEMGLH